MTRSLPAVGDPARAELRQEIYEIVSSGSMNYRQICAKYNFSSTSIVTRLCNEVTKSRMTEEIRDSELARLEAWQEMLNEAAELVLAGDKPEKMADLAKSMAHLSRERRLVLAVDVPVTSKLQLESRRDDEEPPIPEMAKWLDDAKQKFLNSALHRDNLEATGG